MKINFYIFISYYIYLFKSQQITLIENYETCSFYLTPSDNYKIYEFNSTSYFNERSYVNIIVRNNIYTFPTGLYIYYDKNKIQKDGKNADLYFSSKDHLQKIIQFSFEKIPIIYLLFINEEENYYWVSFQIFNSNSYKCITNNNFTFDYYFISIPYGQSAPTYSFSFSFIINTEDDFLHYITANRYRNQKL